MLMIQKCTGHTVLSLIINVVCASACMKKTTRPQWVQCVCKRWVHEDCYEEVLTDKNGRELICPYCVR